MRELLLVINEPHWFEPIVSLVRDAKVVNHNRVIELPTGFTMRSDRWIEIIHPNGDSEKMRLYPSSVVECLLDDGREYKGRTQDEMDLEAWRARMCV